MVAGLSTLAKDGQYYTGGVSGLCSRVFFSLSVKMDMAHCHVHVAGDELHQIAFFPLPQPTTYPGGCIASRFLREFR